VIFVVVFSLFLSSLFVCEKKRRRRRPDEEEEEEKNTAVKISINLYSECVEREEISANLYSKCAHEYKQL
jgi:hypothetical protein